MRRCMFSFLCKIIVGNRAKNAFIERGIKMENYLLISDAAKEVEVESHVLRYWEEELHLPIKRNELGHRYYTREDVECFKQIKNMKEKGLQLKAIKMILKDGKLSMLSEDVEVDGEAEYKADIMPINIVNSREVRSESMESKEEKAQRLQWLLRQLIRDTLQENNLELCREIKESVVKELDYQFRSQEEREEERERIREQRSEEYYQKMDALLRKKSIGHKLSFGKAEKKFKEEKKAQKQASIMDIQSVSQKAKKKRHFSF